MEIIYLDHAAATPVDGRVLMAMQPYMSEQFYNPSSPYLPAVRVRQAYNDAKHRIAECIGAKPDEIVMTAGATESINLVFAGITGHVVTTAVEHAAVLRAASTKTPTVVSVLPNGTVTADMIQKAIKPHTQLISIGLANNELGTIQPLRDIAEVVRAERQRRFEAGEQMPIWLHTDASQGAGQIDINVARLGVDALTLNAAKVYGPKQVGLLWSVSGMQLSPILTGGGQEHGLRSGTENVAGAIGFAMALEIASRGRKSESDRLRALRDQLQHTLQQAFEDMVISGNQKKRLPGHLHVSFPGVDAERLIFALESKGVLVATGSACAANKGTRSHVLTAIALEPAVADGSLRISLGKLNNEQNVAAAAACIIEAVTTERQRSKNT